MIGSSPRALAVPLANGNNVVYEGPHKLLGIRFLGGAAAAQTAQAYDTAGGIPTGGTALEPIIVPALAAPFDARLDRPMRNGSCITLSAELGAIAYVEGLSEPKNLKSGPGTIFFDFGVTATSVARVTTQTVNTDKAFTKSGATSLKVIGNTNPAGDISVAWASGTTATLSPVAPADQIRNFGLWIYLVNPGQNYANGALGDGGSATVQMRLTDGTNQFNSAAVNISQGWNFVIFAREGFAVGAASPSWATTTFTTVEFRVAAGTVGTPEFYLDSFIVNVGHEGAFPFMIHSDDGFDFRDHFAQAIFDFPNLKFNEFLVKNFSEAGGAVYASMADWADLQRKVGKDRLYIGWHSVTHSGATAMEAFAADVIASQEIDLWVTAALDAGIAFDPKQLHGVTPNGQDSASLRTAFARADARWRMVSNRTVRGGVSHPQEIGLKPYDLRQLYISDTASFANLAAHLRVLEQTRCLGTFLTHSKSQENAAGTPISTAATTLNLSPAEYRAFLQALDDRVSAWLAVPLLSTDLDRVRENSQ